MNTIIGTVSKWVDSGQNLILLGMVGALILAALAIRQATHTNNSDTLSTVVTAMILALSAEGMYMVLTTKLEHPIPPYLAWAVCAVVEGLLVICFREAKRFNAQHGRPGPWGAAFWGIATVGGGIVAMSTSSAVEITLRLTLPLSVALLHWIRLTAETSRPKTVTWLITPTRILARLGWLTAGEETLTEAQIKRQTRKIIYAAYRVSAAEDQNQKGRAKRRKLYLRKLMLSATPEAADEAARQIRLSYGMEQRTIAAMQAGKAEGTQTLPEQVAQEPAVISSPPREQLALPPGRSAQERRAEDLKIFNRHQGVLLAGRKAGKLSRYRVEKICDVKSRQAERIMTLTVNASQQNSARTDART